MDPGIPPDPPSRSLVGKVAIVTGAGCLGDGIGNGRAISILLADDGCDVICIDLNLEWANKTVEFVNSRPNRGRALAIRADVTSEEDCQAAVQYAIKAFGRLDILINNVGISGAAGTAVNVDMIQWAKSMETNVASMVQMAKYAIPEMTKNNDEIKGSIVNMGSVAGLKGGTPHLLYPTAKGAIVNMTRAMAAHHSPDGIRVNCVCPGVSQTRVSRSFPSDHIIDALYTHDVWKRHERRSQRSPPKAESAWYRRQWMGLCRGRRLPCWASCTVDDWRSSPCGCRNDSRSGNRHDEKCQYQCIVCKHLTTRRSLLVVFLLM